MWYAIIIYFSIIIWIAYEGWRAPVMRENADGSLTEIVPPKKFKQLFKWKKK